MQHFQSILIVIGIIAIAGVLIHGYFSGRKTKEAETESVTETPDMFAEAAPASVSAATVDDTASEVRVHHDNEESTSDSIDFSQALNSEKVEPVQFNEVDLEPSFQVDAIHNDEQPVAEATLAQENSAPESEQLIPDAEPTVNSAAQEEKVVQPADLFIFNVAAKEGQQLGGHMLLQFFLTSGFRFGEMSIFHRHEHSDGTGPVLFSIANMMAPGVFDPDTMEQFKSEGVSFFLTVPNEQIDIKASFDMMLRAVEQMAEEFDCVVLNADREMMTEAQFLDYRNRLLHYI